MYVAQSIVLAIVISIFVTLFGLNSLIQSENINFCFLSFGVWTLKILKNEEILT